MDMELGRLYIVRKGVTSIWEKSVCKKFCFERARGKRCVRFTCVTSAKRRLSVHPLLWPRFRGTFRALLDGRVCVNRAPGVWGPLYRPVSASLRL